VKLRLNQDVLRPRGAAAGRLLAHAMFRAISSAAFRAQCRPRFHSASLLMVAALAATPGTLLAITDDARQPGHPGYVRDSFYLPVQDGTRLALNTYRPAVDGQAVEKPLPVIFLFTPYRARYRAEDGTIVETALSERLGVKGLTDHGYVVAVADVRGKGASFGHRRGFQDRTEAQDGHYIIEWLAAQPWSDGQVGMTGCSYLGGSTLQVASTAPPSLKAVFVGATDFDKYSFVRRGGITAQFNTRPDEPPEVDLASIPVDADSDGSLLKAAVAEHAQNTPMAALWYGMPYRDSVSSFTANAFWQEVGPYTYLETLRESGIAYYLWGNWSDEPTEQVILAAANLPGARVLIGPGSHCEPSPELDLAGELRRFFDFHLKGIDNQFDQQPPYTWMLQDGSGDGRWIRSQQLPGSGVAHQDFYPDASGQLSPEPGSAPGETTFTVRYDVGSGEYFSFWPGSMDGFGLTFTGAELQRDQALAGFPVVKLVVAIDQADANLFAYLEDLAPDGKPTVVAFGRLAASHRATSPAPYDNLGRPWHSGISTDIEPMIPGQAAEILFALLPNAWLFRAGHRIRLVITGADPRQRNLDSYDQTNPPRITLRVGGKDASRISVPLADPEQLVAEASEDRVIGSAANLGN
jgi:predicted acyl esterase